MTELRVEIEGPNVGAVVEDAVWLLTEVSTGRWGAAVELVSDRFEDPEHAQEQFDLLARGLDHRPVTEVPDIARVPGKPDKVRYRGPSPLLVEAVDLYQRIWMGQFEQIAWYSGEGGMAEALGRLRVELQRPDAWPQHPFSSWSIGNKTQVPEEARVAYDIWKLLGGGVSWRTPLTTNYTVTMWELP